MNMRHIIIFALLAAIAQAQVPIPAGQRAALRGPNGYRPTGSNMYETASSVAAQIASAISGVSVPTAYTSTPLPVNTAGSAGSSVNWAKGDHVHAIAAGVITATQMSATAGLTDTHLAAGAEIADSKLARAWSSAHDAGGYKLTNLGTPTLASDAARLADITGTATAIASLPLGYTSNVTTEQTGNNTLRISGAYAVLTDSGGVTRTAITAISVTADISASVGAGGPDRSSIDNANSWFDIYLIRNPTSLSVAGLIVPAGSTPVMPSGYSESLWVSPARNNASSNFIGFLYSSALKNFDYREDDNNLVAISGGTATSWTGVDLSSLCPPGARWVNALVQLSGTANGGIQLREHGVTAQLWDVGSGTTRYNQVPVIPISQARVIEYQVSGSGANFLMCVLGFKMDK